tara:strand:+ start:1050 stop:1838 length:789 start_codon:yes stop_codon:yes gene_type:complete
MELNIFASQMELIDKISKIEDEDDAFGEILKLLKIYMTKYSYLKEAEILNVQTEKNLKEDITVFKNDTKVMFQILYNFFDNIKMDKEDSDYEEDLEKFDLLKTNLIMIVKSIDENNNYEDFKNNDNLVTSLKYVINYFDEANKNMEELNETIKSGTEMLDKSLTDFENSIKLTEVSTNILKDDVTKEYLSENSKWCKNILKEDFDKEDVITVIKKIQTFEATNYKDLYETEDDPTMKKKYIQYIQIENIMNCIFTIEKKLRG